MKILAVAAGVVALLTPALVLDATWADAVLTCHGLPATIVGKGGEHIIGTEGPDVIVSLDPEAHDAGAFSFDSGAGDDVICAESEAFSGDAGPGDDLVDYSGVTIYTSVILGTGSDTFIGGGQDYVVAGDKGDWGYVDNDLDIIDTGGRRDTVISGGTSPTADRISMGSEGDALYLASAPTPDGSFDLGAGPNRIIIDLAGDQLHDWQVDARTQTLTHGGVASTWRGRVSTYSFTPPDGRMDLTFTGSAEQETVVLDTSQGWLRAELILGAGDDKVLERAPHWRNGSSYDGGPGEDTLATIGRTSDDRWAFHKVWVDLSHHRADYDVQLLDRPDVILSDFERVEAGGRRVNVIGDSTDNVITSQACSSNLSGGNGEDLLDASEQPYGVCESWLMAALVGGRGDDVLIGSPGDDSLDGRGGDDVVRGRGGVDTCRGEDLIGCEIA